MLIFGLMCVDVHGCQTLCLHVCVVSADAVDCSEINVTVGNGNVAVIEWQDPPSPNGVILLYELQLARADIAHVSSTAIRYCNYLMSS